MSELNQYQQMDAISNGVSDFLKEKNDDFLYHAIYAGVKDFLEANKDEIMEDFALSLETEMTKAIGIEVFRDWLKTQKQK